MNRPKVEVITIGPDGTLSGMYADDSVLRSMGGSLTIERVTTINYTEATPEAKGWAIIPMQWADEGKAAIDMPKELQAFSNYEAARAFEIAWVNLCNLAGVALTEDNFIYPTLRKLHEEWLEGVIPDASVFHLIGISCSRAISSKQGIQNQYLTPYVYDIIRVAFDKLSS